MSKIVDACWNWILNAYTVCSTVWVNVCQQNVHMNCCQPTLCWNASFIKYPKFWVVQQVEFMQIIHVDYVGVAMLWWSWKICLLMITKYYLVNRQQIFMWKLRRRIFFKTVSRPKIALHRMYSKTAGHLKIISHLISPV